MANALVSPLSRPTQRELLLFGLPCWSELWSRYVFDTLRRIHHGLLVNDSILVAGMKKGGINTLVRLDSDYDLVPTLSVSKPTDV